VFVGGRTLPFLSIAGIATPLIMFGTYCPDDEIDYSCASYMAMLTHPGHGCHRTGVGVGTTIGQALSASVDEGSAEDSSSEEKCGHHGVARASAYVHASIPDDLYDSVCVSMAELDGMGSMEQVDHDPNLMVVEVGRSRRPLCMTGA
jgi:hypothetical protein